MTYEDIATFAQQGGTLFFMTAFLAGLLYALQPRKKAEFDRAARMPLDGDDD
ncbi:MAG: cbb3-type cytochrome c oxidase subunit 3 [Caulobacteraceae bacterium]|nr:cbb3-type cytochrome c oxidase subunit 3 [Caulobacteraceae bacterium]